MSRAKSSGSIKCSSAARYPRLTRSERTENSIYRVLCRNILSVQRSGMTGTRRYPTLLLRFGVRVDEVARRNLVNKKNEK